MIFEMLFAHYLMDFPLQGRFLGENKSLRNAFGVFLLCVHSFLWTFAIVFVMQRHGIFAPWKAAMLFVGHFIIDGLKCWTLDRLLADQEKIWAFFIDQFLHLWQIAACIVF
jgi:hypothetical protein